MIVHPLPVGDIIETYQGGSWVVVCGGTAIGPFNGEHSLAAVWLDGHCPLGEDADEDGIHRNRCADGRLWLEHRILALWGWR